MKRVSDPGLRQGRRLCEGKGWAGYLGKIGLVEMHLVQESIDSLCPCLSVVGNGDAMFYVFDQCFDL